MSQIGRRIALVAAGVPAAFATLGAGASLWLGVFEATRPWDPRDFFVVTAILGAGLAVSLVIAHRLDRPAYLLVAYAVASGFGFTTTVSHPQHPWDNELSLVLNTLVAAVGSLCAVAWYYRQRHRAADI